MAAADDPLVTAARAWCDELATRLRTAKAAARTLLTNAATLAAEAEKLVLEMDFRFLYHPQRKVFHIGYNLDNGRLDNSYYDLIASEARIASLLAIAKHDVPQEHWLHLARPLTKTSTGEQALLSWSGTMFEYLMPPLIVRSYPDTLLHQSCHAAVEQQIAYAASRNIPWGISESGFYTFDAAMNYQYRAFGAPGLGFKRGLSDDLVIAPYASLMALPLAPQAVLTNMQRLIEYKALGRYGFYEALDFTPGHLGLGQEYAIVRSYMAHHQGMIMLALADYLQGKRMVERFHAEPMIQSIELLLQEQLPPGAPLQYPHEDEQNARHLSRITTASHPWPTPVDSPMPLVHFLSNGRYGLLLTNAGGGYSSNGDLRYTRWRADTTLDDWGCWLYLQDLASGAFWSASRQPTGVRSDYEEVVFHPHVAEFRRRDHQIALRLEVTVSPDNDVEVRRLTLTNESNQPRRLGLVSYGEVVLASSGADGRHPAFAKLFVESEYLADLGLLLFRRRPRSATEEPLFLAHMLVRGAETGELPTIRYESDRARFLGRSQSVQQPAALRDPAWWSGEGVAGATLDPVMVLGQTLELPPYATTQLAWLTFTAPTRDEILMLARRYQGWSLIDRAFVRAHGQAERELRQLGFQGDLWRQSQQLLSLLCYPHAALRAESATLAANRRGQSSLWGFGISGDYPVLLMRMSDEAHGELLHDLVLAHSYWRRRGLRIDLVILNLQDTNYGQPLQNYIYRLLRRLDSDSWVNQRGGIFILRADQMGEAERTLLLTTAHVLLDGRHGSLAAQLADLDRRPTPLPGFEPVAAHDDFVATEPPLARPTDLQFDNGLGGFSADGSEYQIYLRPGETTPAPWINVIANPDFGFLASEVGGGYSWALNSGENRLTTWRNDPVTDLPAEALYLRDEETAMVWSPMPQPAPAPAPYLVRHGAGYTLYEHNSYHLRQQVTLFAAIDAPVKIVKVRLTNAGDRPRRITVTYYAEWVLGVNREQSQQTIVPEYEESVQALLAHNAYNSEFGERVAFVAAGKELHGLTADRSEFLGRLGTMARPAALHRIGLASRIEAGVDPCAVLQLHVDLPVGGEEEVWFLIGQGADREESLALVRRFRDPEQVAASWQAVHEQWDAILGTVTVTTPDPAMNLLLNRWLLYQALASRIWGRSALYQSSGAYGFRDQLQDTLALIHARPDLVREHLLRSARHQFEAGDVLHWWHPPSGRGVRTRISDDLAWLPYVTAAYVAATGDTGVLTEQAPFLRGEPLGETEERYAQYEATTTMSTLYEHCRRALSKAVTAGPHGLPLMGAGDWNDGMNRVGIHGQGESIWLGWFLHRTLTLFATLCETINEAPQAERYRAQAETIRQALEEAGWDGAWYRRAYYDDGTPLGSAQNQECQIDAIAQSWAVLSGAADEGRARQAMGAVLERLVRRDDRLLLLFTPPFDKTPRDPGYIKGYLPGIRENGGQYTHAALWTIWAFAALGDGDTAEELFRLINPIYRSDTPDKAALYKVEPYVISADVYGVAPHEGRGGWTWYTGSSGWMYRLGIEAILGLQRVGGTLVINPCIPKAWPGYTIHYRYGQTVYEIQVENPDGVNRGVRHLTLDSSPVAGDAIPLVDDGASHHVVIVLGKQA
jgi:cyclic beta-1,2-glucan synthetase